MTKRRAKTIALMIWSELARTGDYAKWGVVEKLYRDAIITKKEYDLIVCFNRCPLCAYSEEDCTICPLGFCSHGSLYDNWRQAEEGNEKSRWAKAILERIKGW